MVVVSSKRIPPPLVRTLTIRGRIFGVVLGGMALTFLGWWIWFVTTHTPLPLGIVFALLVVAALGISWSRSRKLRAERGEPDIAKFVRGIDLRVHDPLVVRMVYQFLTTPAHCGDQVQLLPDDDLFKIHLADDMQLDVDMSDAMERLGIPTEAAVNNPMNGKIRTARDILEFIRWQKEQGAS